MVKKTNAYRVLMWKPKRERPNGRPRLRWEDNIYMHITKTGWEHVYWIHVAQGRDKCSALKHNNEL